MHQKTKILIDSNAILRLLLNDIESQATKVEETINAAESQSIVLLDVVLAECYFVLTSKYYNFEVRNVCELLNQIVCHQAFACNKDVLMLTLDLCQSSNLNKFVDCYLAAQLKSDHTSKLITFDKKLFNFTNKKL